MASPARVSTPRASTPQSGNQTERTALIAGSTGLVGGFLLDNLLNDALYWQVRVLVRRPLDRRHDKLQEVVVDFDHLEAHDGAFGVDDVFCCLGTTIKKAGSQEAFRRVDHDYVVEIAERARKAGAQRFLLVSSVGADASAGSFYLKVKGETEDAVGGLGYPALHIFHPSILTGPRQESRPVERLSIVVSRLLSPLMLGPLRRYRPTPAASVAAAMVVAAKASGDGRSVHGYGDIVSLAQGQSAG